MLDRSIMAIRGDALEEKDAAEALVSKTDCIERCSRGERALD